MCILYGSFFDEFLFFFLFHSWIYYLFKINIHNIIQILYIYVTLYSTLDHWYLYHGLLSFAIESFFVAIDVIYYHQFFELNLKILYEYYDNNMNNRYTNTRMNQITFNPIWITIKTLYIM